MKFLKLLFLLIMSLGVAAGMHAQNCKATLCGTVTDAETGEPIAFAEVFFMESREGTITDEQGKFHFHNVCEGTYTLASQHIGCPHVAKEVVITGYTEVDFKLVHEGIHLDEIVIEERAPTPVSVQAEQLLAGAELKALKGQTLGNVLERLPGVQTLRTGAAIVKPVIRGLHSNRILILNNGVRQEGQQWGLDHGPEIDPYLAGEMKVVMGASSVRYGSDALGGVILVEPKPLREQPGLGGEVNLAGFSNGRTGVLSGMIDGKSGGRLPLSGRLQGTFKRGGNMHTPGYYLQNSGVRESNASAAVGLKKGDLDLEAFYSLFYTDIGILEDAHIGNLTDLRNAIDRGRPLQDGSFTYDLDRPLQRVAHHLFKSRAKWKTAHGGALTLMYARQFNRRQEFDAHRPFGDPPSGFENPEMEFEITTHTVDAVWTHPSLSHFKGQLGAQYMEQVNTTDRGGLIPDYRARTMGVYWIEQWRRWPFPLEFEAGVRFDHRFMDIQQRGKDIIDEQLSFNNLSGTAGAVYRAGDHLVFRFHSGTAWRAPSVNELYSEGVHHGSASFESGNDELTPERAWSNNLSLELDLPGSRTATGLTARLSVYYNLVDQFIYLQPQENPVLTIRGAFPSFAYRQADARLSGLDWNAEWKPVSMLGFSTSVSLLRARNLDADEYLVFMPPDRYLGGVSWYPLSGRPDEAGTDDTFLRLEVMRVPRQSRVPEGQDFAPPPAGYTLVNFAAGWRLQLRGKNLQLGLTVQNLFNTSYRNYLNRLRYYAEETGRNVGVMVNYEL